MPTPYHIGALALALLAIAPAPRCSAQSLHGSVASVNRMYRHARAEGLAFYETPRGVRRAVAAGRLVALSADSNVALHDVSYPYVRPAARTFVERLGAEYRAACGRRLEVTSAVRPETRQPANSVARSVHPTGMAVDLHKSDDPACRGWLRQTLLSLEGEGVIEATEEFSPPHFHVAVYPIPYERRVAALANTRHEVQLASSASIDLSRYRVRAGDTLWDIARQHGITVRAIRVANDLRGSTIQPGDTLLIPAPH